MSKKYLKASEEKQIRTYCSDLAGEIIDYLQEIVQEAYEDGYEDGKSEVEK